jgi:hypothetical protein
MVRVHSGLPFQQLDAILPAVIGPWRPRQSGRLQVLACDPAMIAGARLRTSVRHHGQDILFLFATAGTPRGLFCRRDCALPWLPSQGDSARGLPRPYRKDERTGSGTGPRYSNA